MPQRDWLGPVFLVFLSLFPSFALWRQGGEGALHEGYITYEVVKKLVPGEGEG